MPDPLSPQAADAADFGNYVKRYSGTVYALSCLLLGKGASAEHAAAATFAALYPLCQQGSLQAADFSVAACMECIRQCSLLAQDSRSCISAPLSWEDQIASALWYGIQLPLPEISRILQRSVPELKTQLRNIREQMAVMQAELPAVSRPSAG